MRRVARCAAGLLIASRQSARSLDCSGLCDNKASEYCRSNVKLQRRTRALGKETIATERFKDEAEHRAGIPQLEYANFALFA